MTTRISLVLSALVFIAGCPVGGFKDPNAEIDRDHDGVAADQDCDDRDEDVGKEREFFVDADGDSFGNREIAVMDCVQPDGFVRNDDDCNDIDPATKPGGVEVCNGRDDDCDGNTDSMDAELTNGVVYFFDGDDDGYGDSKIAVRSCEPVAGYTPFNGDCDDDIAAINPGMLEESKSTCNNGIDDDCDKLEDADDSECEEYLDLDEDGVTIDEGDCNDDDEDVSPNIVENSLELCKNGVDDDCDELADVAKDPGCSGFVDEDKDTWYLGAGDCDDKDATRNPGEIEICSDGKDTDCDGNSNSSESDCYNVDLDGDGSAPPSDCKDDNKAINPAAVEIPDNGVDENCDGVDGKNVNIDDDGDGFTEAAGDCDDVNKSVNPSAVEGPSNGTCGDSLDNDCDKATDLNDSACRPAADGDGDGFPSNVDCNDGNKSIFPGAAENCVDGVDNDCDKSIDKADSECGAVIVDADSDGFPSGVDCNDGNKAINPGATDLCGNGVDEDCKGGDLSCTCVDVDGDSFLAATCGGTDCNDGNKAINTSATEVCTGGVDENCNGLIDGADKTCQTTTGPDADGDGYPAPADCLDSNKAVNPGAVDVCGDALDSNCDGDSLTCLGIIACVDNGSNLLVTVTGDIRAQFGPGELFTGASKVYIYGADTLTTPGATYTNATTSMSFALAKVDFYPYATDGSTALNPDLTGLPSGYFKLDRWSVTGACKLNFDTHSINYPLMVDFVP